MPRPCLKKDILLSDVTTIGIGGPAQEYLEIRSIDECRDALRKCKDEDTPFFILGKGSNCLFSDQGFYGTLLHIKIDTFEDLGNGCFKVGAGFSFSLLGTRSAREGWGGLEFATGIPASVGGAVFMNAGANGQETSNSLVEVEFLHPDGTVQTFSKKELSFSYRTSPFQQWPGVILSATFQLHRSDSAKERQQSLFQYRKTTQPYHEKSAGCIYRNPQGFSAGALIEKSGLKGTSVGGAAVSEMHGNFLVNRMDASAGEFLHLMEHVERTVFETSGIKLQREVRMISPTGELYEH